MLETINVITVNLADRTPIIIEGPIDAIALRLGGRELPVIEATWRDYAGGSVVAELGAGMDGQLWQSVTLVPGAAQLGTVDVLVMFSDAYDYPRPLALGANLIPTYTAHLPWAADTANSLALPPVHATYNTSDIKVRDVAHNYWFLSLTYIFSADAVILTTGEIWKINILLTWDVASSFWLSPNLVPPGEDPLTTAMSIWLSIAQTTVTPNVWHWAVVSGGWPYPKGWATIGATAELGKTPPTANPWLNPAAPTVALTSIRLSLP